MSLVDRRRYVRASYATGQERTIFRTARIAMPFYLALGQTKNFCTPAFLADLQPGGVILDARSVPMTHAARWVSEAQAAGSDAIIDPVSYFDQAARTHRNAGYRALPYGNNAPVSGFASPTAARAYVRPILRYQLRFKPNVVIAPYLFATPSQPDLVEESLTLGDVARGMMSSVPVWSGLAVSGSMLTTANIDVVTDAVDDAQPDVLYLLVAATQDTAAPLADEIVLRGIGSVIRAAAAYGGRVIVGRRYSSGLVALALGAVGWSTGYHGVHQNFEPPPQSAPERQGKGADWAYVPALLNSLRLDTRARVHRKAPLIVAPTTTYDAALFGTAPTLTTLNTAQRVLLNQHNLRALKAQASGLLVQAAGRRRAYLKARVKLAQSAYASAGGPWRAGEKPDFLTAWDSVL